ncbi:hypothetical protein MUN84_03405 [Hymenobacter sp. 5516J-16]|uniref:hypothetical protein n=1 Tax=Hymenobacter sp. 5516J-16 TaxID=2932253 RepID=UPI001FD07835|nr:hypothetical protein [Hymenobacter sp. 5516J-16]UOQ77729.1 hypothetical protein MUN84_03405 [Hymenobacter sp. 5516J-16]
MSSILQYYRNPLGSITYDPAGFVQLTWSDAPISSPELQSIYAHTLQALRHHAARKLLTDQRQRQLLPLAEQQWIVEHWIPRAVQECAYNRCAIVQSQDTVRRQAARAVGQALGTNPPLFQYFTEEDMARTWLQQDN